MIPLVPPATDAVAVVARPAPHDEELVMSNAITQPVALEGQLMAALVSARPATLRKIESVPLGLDALVMFGLKNSVTGEQAVSAVVIVGPGTGVPMAPETIGICHSAVSPPFVPQTYKLPVLLAEL